MQICNETTGTRTCNKCRNIHSTGVVVYQKFYCHKCDVPDQATPNQTAEDKDYWAKYRKQLGLI